MREHRTDKASRAAAVITPETEVSCLPGVGPKRAAAMAERAIRTLRDLLFHLPARYQDWRVLTPIAGLAPGATVTVCGELGKIAERPMRGSPWRRLASGMLTEQGGAKIRLVWFNLPGYMRGRMPAGESVLAHGRVTATADGGLEIAQPELHPLALGEPPPVRAVYRLPASIGQRVFAAMVRRALDATALQIKGALPDELSPALSIGDSLRYLHQPPADADRAELERGDSPGHRALAFDELFAFELALCLERERAAGRAGVALGGPAITTSRWLSELPFALTAAQTRALGEIGADLERPSQMHRMLMGDVGSGKTIVAFWAALRAVECGYQAAIMAPTELLAEQHHTSFQSLCGRLGVVAGLLTGKVAGAPRAATLRSLASGAMPIVFGTHAIIQERVRIRRLGLGVIDEQHRFGVFDRARFKALGAEANLLMMTATPIPRSLAMSLFANLEVSILDELPPGRTPITTEILGEPDLDRLEGVVHGELRRGNRAYYVLPRIEAARSEGDDDSAEDEMRTVAAMAERLRRGALGEFKIAIMHGKMRAPDKEETMRRFRDGAIQVLVSTTVVEVGIDVPEASVIVIVAAERYGLAQLHQLRGRVGRGRAASRCFLVASRGADPSALERLAVMTACASGAEVANEDLRIRGPGDLLGARQTGALPLKFIHLVRDPHTIERARAMAEDWLRRDPGLRSPQSQGARRAIRRMLTHGFSLGDVG
ncbi:MAG TPA: ATP-dependent DNA helicase RecG [Candidatus Binataceae bacterium]|nr:ATP-dependent DNA helicase RecG [Candidatus Binataceae bacterium]